MIRIQYINYVPRTVLVGTFAVHRHIGKCKKCGDEIRTATIYENDKQCVECQFKLDHLRNRKGRKI